MDTPTIRHCLVCVYQEVKDCLLDLSLVDIDENRIVAWYVRGLAKKIEGLLSLSTKHRETAEVVHRLHRVGVIIP